MMTDDDDAFDPVDMTWLEECGAEIETAPAGNKVAKFMLYDEDLEDGFDDKSKVPPEHRRMKMWLRIHEPHSTTKECVVDVSDLLYNEETKEVDVNTVTLLSAAVRNRGEVRALVAGTEPCIDE